MSGSGIRSTGSTLSPNASPFVPKNFSLPVVATTPQASFAAAAPTATVPDSDMSYAPALSANVQTIYVTGLPGYYAPYMPTPAVPFYTMQYQCLYQPTPPMGVCCPMEEGMPAVADEPPPTLVAPPTVASASMQQQPMLQNTRGKKKKNRNGRRKDGASHRDSSSVAMADTDPCSVVPVICRATLRSGESAARAPAIAANQEEWQGGVASPDFSSSSEFPSLPVQDFPRRQSPSGISYSTALQQQKAPQPAVATSVLAASRDSEEQASSSSGGNVHGSQQQGHRGSSSNSGTNDRNNRHHKRGSGSRKHRRGGGGGGEGGKRAEDGEPLTRFQQHQQERRGPKKGGGGKTSVAVIDGGAEKHQFEASEKDVKLEPRHEAETIAANGSRAGSVRTPHQNGVRVNATRGRRETRHSSLLRGVLRGDGGRHQQQGSRGSRKGPDMACNGPARVEEGSALHEGSAKRKSWNSTGSPVREKDSKDEYPPLGSCPHGSREQTPEARTARHDAKDTVAKAGDNIPKQQQQQQQQQHQHQHQPHQQQQQQPSLREKGSKPSGPVKPLASTNGGSGSGPKHKTAISMSIADIMVPKQRQPKKLKEKENLLERSSKKPEVGSWQP